jgi:hypothetical protein
MDTSAIVSFVLEIAKYTTNANSEDLVELINLTRRLHTVNERLCMEEYNIEPLIRRQQRIENRIKELAGKIGAIGVGCSNDPRYATVRLFFEGMPDYMDGIGVPF